jgi:hypothetical protein
MNIQPYNGSKPTTGIMGISAALCFVLAALLVSGVVA